jgi:hypothetical protein
MTASIRAFCVPGGHTGPDIPVRHNLSGTWHPSMGAMPLPEGWQLLRARYSVTRQCWVSDKRSPASVVCCPDHLPEEPTGKVIKFPDKFPEQRGDDS